MQDISADEESMQCDLPRMLVRLRRVELAMVKSCREVDYGWHEYRRWKCRSWGNKQGRRRILAC